MDMILDLPKIPFNTNPPLKETAAPKKMPFAFAGDRHETLSKKWDETFEPEGDIPTLMRALPRRDDRNIQERDRRDG